MIMSLSLINLIMDDSEQYIFLGKKGNTYFWLHSVINAEFTEEISYQIYNAMINEKMIQSHSEEIVIYEFIKDKSPRVIIITHDKNKIETIYPDNVLKEVFEELTEADRSEMFVIRYNYIKKCYLSYNFPGGYIKKMDMDESVKLDIHNVSCLKTIDYLS